MAFEALRPQAKKLVRPGATVDEMLATAIKEGMRTLKQDGIQKILQGHTNVDQIRRRLTVHGREMLRTCHW